MSQSTLEKNTLETFDKVNPNLVDSNLDDLDNDFKYLFPTLPLPVHDVDQGGTNNLLAIIDRSQQQRNLLNKNISISNDLFTKITI